MTLDSKTMVAVTCSICEAPAIVLVEDHPGYMEPARFDIAWCSTCNTAFVHPEGADPGPIYDRIYAQADRVPGYDRYRRYARGVLDARDPLRFLAEAEDVYWAVERHLDGRGGGPLRILEVGSGFGYLTYALARRGHEVKGIDLSPVAVKQARQTYGDFYEAEDVADLALREPGRYDVVIMNELIEHVPDPAGLLEAVAGLLAPRGEIVVTTPDKAYYPPSWVWETELPPVHLWWFSESSLRFLAHRLGLVVRFIDLGDCNRTLYCVPPRVKARSDPRLRPAVLDAQGVVRGGQVMPGGTRLARSLSRRLGLTHAVRRVQARLATAIAGPCRRRPTLCAVVSNG